MMFLKVPGCKEWVWASTIKCHFAIELQDMENHMQMLSEAKGHAMKQNQDIAISKENEGSMMMVEKGKFCLET